MFRTLGKAVHGASSGLQQLAGAGVDLASDKERDERVDDALKVTLPAHQVVLVAAVRVARRVGVVLEEVDLAADALLFESLLCGEEQSLQNPLPRLVVGDDVIQAVTLGCGVLRVAADVEVEPGTVLEEHIRGTTPAHDSAEQVPGYLVGREPALPAQRAGDPVLVLDSENAAFHDGQGRRRVGPKRAKQARTTTLPPLAVRARHNGVMQQDRTSRFVRIATVSDLATGHVLAARLRSENIDVRLHSQAFGPYPMTVGHLAEAELWVASDRVEEAGRILLDAEVRDAIAPAEVDGPTNPVLPASVRIVALGIGLILAAMWVARLIRVF